MKEERLMRLEEVAVAIGVSGKTINNWYMFKKQFPDSDYAKKLPEFTQSGSRQTRYWKESDIETLINFKNNLPIGRNGVMGAITQKYVRKRKENEEKNNE